MKTQSKGLRGTVQMQLSLPSLVFYNTLFGCQDGTYCETKMVLIIAAIAGVPRVVNSWWIKLLT